MKTTDRREFIRSTALSVGASVLATGWGGCGPRPEKTPGEDRRAAAKPPNVLIVLCDQLRSSALGCMGNDHVLTPNIDELARRGVRFENAFACSPVCSPCRSQILTGKLTGPRGTRNELGSFLYKLPLSETTIAEHLRDAGYATGYIGKWHVSPHGVRRPDGFVPPGEPRHGFDYWAAIEVPHDHYDAKYFRDSPEPLVARGFSCNVETDLAIRFIEDRGDAPFFLMLSWNPPHDPYKPPPEHDVYNPDDIPLRPNVPDDLRRRAQYQLAGYYGLISAVDFNLGRILSRLDELDLTRDTLICFCSDHGSMLYSQGVLQQDGAKRRPWRESAQVPMILCYPRSIEPGQVRDTFIGSIDVMPTLLGLAGLATPGDVQGRDFSPLLLGQPCDEPDSIFLHITARGRTTPFSAPWRAVRTSDWMYAASGGLEDGDWLLYDLAQDPYEMNNLIDDPGHQARKDEMKARLEDWRRHFRDSLDLGQFYARQS